MYNHTNTKPCLLLGSDFCWDHVSLENLFGLSLNVQIGGGLKKTGPGCWDLQVETPTQRLLLVLHLK